MTQNMQAKMTQDEQLNLASHVLANNCPELHGDTCPVLSAYLSNEAIFRAIHDNVVDGIVSLNESGSILSCNLAIEKILGYTIDELMGQNISIILPEMYRQKDSDYGRNFAKTYQDDIIGKNLDISGLHKDGSIIPIRMAVSATILNGKLLITGILRDISQYKKQEKELRDAKEKAEAYSKAKSLFLANMSHELRTPLNAVIGFTQMLQIVPIDDADVRDEYLGIINSSANHLLGLINEILDLAKIEAGMLEFFSESFSPRLMLDESIRLNEDQAKKRGISIIDKTKGRSLSEIFADERRFKQILINLLSNAIKYNKDNGTVTLNCFQGQSGKVRFQVKDTGKGIMKGLENKIFETFNRLDAEHEVIEGAGIGLSLSKQMVEKMGGSIGYSSELGKGSSFWFELPISKINSSNNDYKTMVIPETSAGSH